MHINIFNLIKQLEYSDDYIKIIEVTKAEEVSIYVALNLMLEYNLDNTVLYSAKGERGFTLGLDHEYRDVYVLDGQLGSALLEVKQNIDSLRTKHGNLRFIFCISSKRDLMYIEELVNIFKERDIPVLIILDCPNKGIYELMKVNPALKKVKANIHKRNIIEESTYLEDGKSPSNYKEMLGEL